MLPNLSLAELLEAAQNKATLGAFTSKLMKNFGGAEGFADVVHEDYDAAPKGSNQRAMIARSIIELMKQNEPAGGEDISDRPPEEIAAAFTALTKRIGGKPGA